MNPNPFEGLTVRDFCLTGCMLTMIGLMILAPLLFFAVSFQAGIATAFAAFAVYHFGAWLFDKRWTENGTD